MTVRHITHVAIRYKGVIYALPSPNRHHNIIRLIGGIKGPHEEGFLLDDGSFLGRIGAMQLAKDNGQLKHRPVGYSGTKLFSEDLW